MSEDISLDRLTEQSLVDLEWPLLLEKIAEEAAGDLGRAEIRALTPCALPDEVRVRQGALSELFLLYEVGAELPARDVVDVAPTLGRIQKGGTASGQELCLVLRMLTAALELGRFAEVHRETAPLIARMFQLAPELGPAARALARSIGDDGEVLDQASPDLADARAKVRQLRRKVQSRIVDLIAKYREALQDGYFAERDGRFVLPVRADAPFKVEGFVFGTSQSGSTLYVEPKELAQLGHELRMAEVDAEREEARVLHLLCAQLLPLCDELRWALEILARADLLFAVVRFSRKIRARVVPLAHEQVADLRSVRHPLLAHADTAVVANDLRVDAGRGLVVSGPNAGGKTVALKCLGLLAVMQASGLPLPVLEGSVVGFFDLVLADIGDDQSLSQSLSTFSGHVRRVREFLAQSARGTLILLDELMGGTDPAEGAVLAMATLDAMVERDAAVVVTTHYDALKDFALGHARLESAAVGFDFARMEPTFRVEMGRPGASSALHVARRYGLPTQLVDRAESFLPELDARARRDRIEIEQMKAELERQQRDLAHKVSEQERLNRKKEHEARLLAEARVRDLARESDELRIAIRDARGELRRLRSELKDADTSATLRQIERGIARVSSVVSLGSEVDRAVRAADEPSRDIMIEPGMKVRMRKLQGMGEVLETPRKGQVKVLVGTMKLTMSVADLELDTKRDASARRKPGPRPASPPVARQVTSPLVKSQDVVLDLRGKRVESGLDELDAFIDELLKRQEGGGFVLHGHGTGAMKDAVREHLRAHVCVQQSRPGERDEGGDAFTLFWLQGF